MPDENRVFDVARPGRSAPQPTAKPVIVGHHPMQSDPMVKDDRNPMDFGTEATPTKISVVDESPSEHHLEPGPELPVAAEPEPKPEPEPETPKSWSLPVPEPQPEPAPELNPPAPEPPAEMPPTVEESMPPEPPAAPEPAPTAHDETQPTPPSDDASLPEEPAAPMAHVEALHFEPHHRGGRAKWHLLGLLVLLVAAYLAIDAGLVGSGIKLPFHIFKQKTETPAATITPPTNQKTTTPTTNLPAGFTKYGLIGTDITFAAPTAWGKPNSAAEDGYSSRSASAKPDGTYAYTITFPDNKDIQLVVTSSKFLPAARGAQYYDFLQWCTGTNDGKIYKSVLNFTTANGVSTPTTISCDQGPLTDATKLSDNSIVQLKTKDATGAVIGDLYTKNLSETALPVFRIKDAAMTNGDSIKLMLPTIKPAND